MRIRSNLIHIITRTMAVALVMVGVSRQPAGAALPPVEQVVVYKSLNIMKLLNGTDVVRTYQVALGKNPRGHKQKAGDNRTPEGTYRIDFRNKFSKYYKALHITYPNSRDLTTASGRGLAPGGDIMIHGLPKGFDDLADSHYRKNWTKGCIAVNNAEMDEIWQLVADGTPITIRP